MKKNYFYLLFMALCTVCMFTACSSDDDDNNDVKKPIVLNDIIGTYKGTLQVMGSPIEEQLTLNKIDDSHVRVQLKDFSFGAMSIGDISADCSVAKNESATEYDIYGTATVTVAMLGNVELPVVVDGDCDGKELEVTISIKDIPAIGELEVEFFGKK